MLKDWAPTSVTTMAKEEGFILIILPLHWFCQACCFWPPPIISQPEEDHVPPALADATGGPSTWSSGGTHSTLSPASTPVPLFYLCPIFLWTSFACDNYPIPYSIRCSLLLLNRGSPFTWHCPPTYMRWRNALPGLLTFFHQWYLQLEGSKFALLWEIPGSNLSSANYFSYPPVHLGWYPTTSSEPFPHRRMRLHWVRGP